MALRQRACFSITARLLIPVRKAIDAIDDQAWTPIKYNNAVYDEQSGNWVSNAEVAEISYTVFATDPRRSGHRAAGRAPGARPQPDNQSELFSAYRYHAVFTNSPLPMLQA